MSWQKVSTPRPLILVRCKRCRKPVGKLWDDGQWECDVRQPCACDPPPMLPEGDELARLVARALRQGTSPVRAAINVFR